MRNEIAWTCFACHARTHDENEFVPCEQVNLEDDCFDPGMFCVLVRKERKKHVGLSTFIFRLSAPLTAHRRRRRSRQPQRDIISPLATIRFFIGEGLRANVTRSFALHSPRYLRETQLLEATALADCFN